MAPTSIQPFFARDTISPVSTAVVEWSQDFSTYTEDDTDRGFVTPWQDADDLLTFSHAVNGPPDVYRLPTEDGSVVAEVEYLTNIPDGRSNPWVSVQPDAPFPLGARTDIRIQSKLGLPWDPPDPINFKYLLVSFTSGGPIGFGVHTGVGDVPRFNIPDQNEPPGAMEFAEALANVWYIDVFRFERVGTDVYDLYWFQNGVEQIDLFSRARPRITGLVDITIFQTANINNGTPTVSSRYIRDWSLTRTM